MILREKRELEQVHLCLGSRGFPQQGDERYAAALFNAILGGGMSSRLFQRIREKEGLVYTVMSYHNGYRQRRLRSHLRRLRAEEPQARARHDARGDAQDQERRRHRATS